MRMNNLLKGVRVLDFSMYLPGPFASMRLADRGAEVISIEPVQGDPSRHMGIQREGTGVVFLAVNRNKKSVALDLKSEEGREAVKELIQISDVLIESFRPGVMERLGLSYEQSKEWNPGLVYCSISGYGQDTVALNGFGSHDLNYMALTGMLAQLTTVEGKPAHPSIQFADYIGSFGACEEILASLLHQKETGEGTHIDLALTDSLHSILGVHSLIHQETGREYGINELNGGVVCYGIYETLDERFITLAALEQSFWRNFCTQAGKKEWISKQFSPAKDGSDVFEKMKSLFKSRTFREWSEFSKRVDCCMAPILRLSETEDHPVTQERGMFYELGGGLKQVATSTVFSQKKTMHPPSIGEHTEEVLTSLLGWPEEKVKRLQSNH